MAENDDKKPTKKKSSGFFDFIFNTSKFVEDLSAEAESTGKDQPDDRSPEHASKPDEASVETTQHPDAASPEMEVIQPTPSAPHSLEAKKAGAEIVTVEHVSAVSHQIPVVSLEPAKSALLQNNLVVSSKVDVQLLSEQSTALLEEPEREAELSQMKINEPDLSSPDGFRSYLNSFSYYDLLQMDPESTSKEIHVGYIKRMHKLLRPGSEESQLAEWQFKELVRTINIGHQVLTDPASRPMYDAYLARPKDEIFSQISQSQAGKVGMVVDILELVRMFKLLGQFTNSALDKIRERSSGKSERELAAFLVEEGLITEEQMESLVLARFLLATSKITMSQLELVMDEITETKAPLWVSLVAKGFIKMSDVT